MVRYPGEPPEQYLERVRAERARHNSNSGMWDERLEREDGTGIRMGYAEYEGELKMAVEPITEEEMR